MKGKTKFRVDDYWNSKIHQHEIIKETKATVTYKQVGPTGEMTEKTERKHQARVLWTDDWQEAKDWLVKRMDDRVKTQAAALDAAECRLKEVESMEPKKNLTVSGGYTYEKI